MEDYRIERKAQSLERYIEDLLRSWTETQNMQRQLEDFNEKHEAPEPPDKFETVAALMEYNERKRRYDERLQGYSRRALEHRQNFERESARLMGFFPDGVPLLYKYQSYGAGPVGKTFEIQKVVTEDRPSIQIRELDS